MNTVQQKTIEAKIPYQYLTNTKQQALDSEYKSVQKYTHGRSNTELYSATKQQQDRKLDKINENTEYPWFLRNDVFDVEKHNTNQYEWWINIPVSDVYGGINVPIQPHKDLSDYNFGDSKIIKRNGDYYVQLTAKKQIEVQTEYDGVLAVDLGVRHVATSVALPSRDTTFYGDKIRQFRRHSHELRSKLQEKGAYQTLKSVRSREHRQVDDRLHKISRNIVDEAKRRNSLIIIGDLEGVQNQDCGSEQNRRLHSMPHYTLKEYVKYKAMLEGIVVKVEDEYMTSQTCWRCGEQGNTTREGQGRHLCRACGLDDNADKNGAINIGKRGLGKDVTSPLSSLGGNCELSLELSGDEESAIEVSVSVRLQANSEAQQL